MRSWSDSVPPLGVIYATITCGIRQRRIKKRTKQRRPLWDQHPSQTRVLSRGEAGEEAKARARVNFIRRQSFSVISSPPASQGHEQEQNSMDSNQETRLTRPAPPLCLTFLASLSYQQPSSLLSALFFERLKAFFFLKFLFSWRIVDLQCCQFLLYCRAI